MFQAPRFFVSWTLETGTYREEAVGTRRALPGGMSDKSQESWVVIEQGQTSVGVRTWSLQRGSMRALVFELTHGAGALVRFDDSSLDELAIRNALRVGAHAAQCYALSLHKVMERSESGHFLDVRPGEVHGGVCELGGSDALVALRFYFGEVLS